VYARVSQLIFGHTPEVGLGACSIASVVGDDAVQALPNEWFAKARVGTIDFGPPNIGERCFADCLLQSICIPRAASTMYRLAFLQSSAVAHLVDLVARTGRGSRFD
jgi:hypothetical protein